MTDQVPDPLLSVASLAERTDVCDQTVRRWAHRGLLPYYDLPCGLRFRLSDVEKFLADRYMAA